MPCYSVEFDVDGTKRYARVHGDVPTSDKTVKAIEAVAEAAYRSLLSREKLPWTMKPKSD